MSRYKLKAPKQAEAVTGAYRKIEETVVGAYQKIEDTVVSGYKAVEGRFIDAFLEEAEEPEKEDPASR